MRLLLIRHAESAGNAAGIIQGWADLLLSPRGQQQAELLAERMARDHTFDFLYASPLLRADATARAIADRTGHPIEPLADLREYDFGEVNGMLYRDALERYPAEPGQFPVYPGEEGRERFRERIDAAFRRLEESHSDATVAVVSHGGPIAVFTQSVLGLPYRRPLPFAIHNASITTIDLREGRGTVIGVNDTCHLDAMG
jgi:broad specificity phosphatase PhoE